MKKYMCVKQDLIAVIFDEKTLILWILKLVFNGLRRLFLVFELCKDLMRTDGKHNCLGVLVSFFASGE
jgi:hypothetical protein